MSASFYDLMKYARTGIASPSMTYYDKQKALAMCKSGFPISTITGATPLSFRANGKPLISLSMLGNTQQTGTPSPQSIIMPTLCGVRTAQRFISDDRTAMTASCTVKYEKGAISIVGTASNNGGRLSPVTDTIHLEVGTYTISLSQSIRAVLFLQNAQDNTNYYSILSGTTSKTFTINEEADYYVSFNLVLDTIYDEHAYFMLNTGSTALPYEPYGWSEKITCAGQTTPVYLGQTQTVRRIKKLVLTGDENWEITGNNSYVYLNKKDLPALQMPEYQLLCTHFVESTVNGMHNGNNWVLQTTAYKSVASDIATWKSWLAQQYATGTPVTIWYVLATPETAIANEPLAKIGDYADELHSTDAAVTIQTVKGQNTLTVDTELQPSSVSLTGGIK